VVVRDDALLGVLTITGVIQPWMLLLITLAIGAGSAVDLPAWQAIIPETVPRDELPAAWDSAASRSTSRARSDRQSRA